MRLLEETAVDLILLDLMMPEVDGWTVLNTVKEDDRFRTIPVLIVTSKDPLVHPDEVEAHAGLFDGWLMKPFLGAQLLAMVEKALA